MPIKPKRFYYLRVLSFDFYLLKEVLGTFFGASFFIIFVLLMAQALRLAEFFVLHGVSASTLGKLSFFMGISFLPITLPLAFVIAILMAFSRLSADSELIALKASGLSLFRIAFPLLILALVVSEASIFLNMEWVPWGERAFKRTQNRVGNTKAVALLKEGAFTTGFFDLLIFADKVDSKNNRLSHVFIYDEREPKNPLTYVAKEAFILPIKSPSELGAEIILKLIDGSMHSHTLATEMYERVVFHSYLLHLKIDEGADTTQTKPHMIPQADLIQKISKSTLETYEGREYRGEYWRRYATAFTPIIFVFLGIGFGSSRARNQKTGAILIGFVILVTYWTLQTIGTAAVLRGSLSPFVAMQMPNAIMLCAAVYRFRRSNW